MRELQLGDRDEVDIIGAVRDAQCACSGPQPRQRDIVRDARAAMRLNRRIQYCQHSRWRQHLCGSDLTPRLQQRQVVMRSRLSASRHKGAA